MTRGECILCTHRLSVKMKSIIIHVDVYIKKVKSVFCVTEVDGYDFDLLCFSAADVRI